jgi:hypothetical protein
MKREATFHAKGEQSKVELDYLYNNCRIVQHEGVTYSLMLSIDSDANQKPYWHLSIGSIQPPSIFPPDDLCKLIIPNILGEMVGEGDPDPRRPNNRHFVAKVT